MSDIPVRKFQCMKCGHYWEVPFGGGRQLMCPNCGSMSILRTNPGTLPPGRMGRRRNRRRRQSKQD